jgi:hypothetical protein
MKTTNKINEAEGRDTLAELNEMTLGQLERIADYANMIKDRIIKGEELESWMYSQLTISLENLNSVHDAMDGNDGVVEAKINEAKELDRDKMIEFLGKYLGFVRTSEEFDGTKGGIWTSAENGESLSGSKIFNYYSDSSKYEFGVLNKFADLLNKRGWYCEFYDPGTVMIWPN